MPSSRSTSSTHSGLRVVMLRAVALRLESGAITASSMSGTASSALRSTCRPVAPMPSSLVSRTLMRSTRIGDVLEVQPVRGSGVAGLGPGPALQQAGEVRRPCSARSATSSIVPTSTRTMLRMNASASIQ